MFGGYYLAARGITPPGTEGVLMRIVFNVVLPCMLFGTMVRANLKAVFSASGLVNILTTLIATLLTFLIMRFILRWRGAELSIATIAVGITNAGNLGTAFLAAITHDASQAAPIIIFQIAIITPIAFWILDGQTGRESGGIWRSILRQLENPVLLSVLIGLAAALCHWEPPAWIMRPADFVGAASAPLVLLGIGMSMRGARLPKFGGGLAPVCVVTFMRTVAAPLIATGLGWAFGLHAAALLPVVVVSAFPTANNVFVYAHRYQTAIPLARDANIITTFASLISIFVISALFL